MAAWSEHLPGWMKRRHAEESEPDVASTSTGAGSDTDTGSGSFELTGGGGSSNDPVVVWNAPHWLEAEVVRGRLQSEGIPAFIRGEAYGMITGLTVGHLAQAQVLVPGLLADKALEILAADMDADAAPELEEEFEEDEDAAADELGDQASDQASDGDESAIR